MSFLLASASERRKELLAMLDVSFDIFNPDIDEEMEKLLSPEELAVSIGNDKMNYALKKNPTYDYILAADTFLSFESRILGKAESKEKARDMLWELSEKTHKVITGMVFYSRKTGNVEKKAVSTDVTFKKLCSEDIDWYIKSGEWAGVAGAYRIQGKGACLIKEINGSWTNVVGLPLEELYGILRLHKIV